MGFFDQTLCYQIRNLTGFSPRKPVSSRDPGKPWETMSGIAIEIRNGHAHVKWAWTKFHQSIREQHCIARTKLSLEEVTFDRSLTLLVFAMKRQNMPVRQILRNFHRADTVHPD